MAFEKPTKISVTDSEYINNLINVNLQKDLHDNEEICPYCHGTGLVIRDNEYGLSDDPDKSIKNLFPYKHQSLNFCPHCYDGVIHRCQLCGEFIRKGSLKHDCEKQREIDETAHLEKWKEKIKTIPEATDEMVKNSFYLYSDSFPYNEGFFMDWDEFFEAWYDCECDSSCYERPEYAFIPVAIEPSADAQDIASSITDDLYENAYDDIKEGKIEELQEFMDKWCKECGINTTYIADYKYKVKIPWDEYDENKNIK